MGPIRAAGAYDQTIVAGQVQQRLDRCDGTSSPLIDVDDQTVDASGDHP
ncbi:hypothetical protein KFU94_69475 [Chloroflexi bacterium TSY]|nr:hypothetical protein [Chloroflexi bacterium TSY]